MTKPFPSSPPTGGQPRPWVFPTTESRVLDSGLEIRSVSIRSLPIVHLRWSFRAGRTHEDITLPGVSQMVSALARHGTEGFDSQTLARALDRLGARLRVSVAMDNTVVALSALSEHLDQVLDLLDEVALRPRFPEADLERERTKALEFLRHQQRDPDFLAGTWLARAIYGDHPYGAAGATEQGLVAVNREKLHAFHRNVFNPANGLLMVVGDIDAASAVDQLAHRHRDLSGTAETGIPTPCFAERHFAPRVIAVNRPGSEQVALSVGKAVMDRRHPERLALRVANQVLGASASSRLFMELRERRSLTYGAYSTLDTGNLGGDFSASLSCSPDKLTEAVQAVRSEITGFGQTLLAEEELDSAKRYMIGSFPQKASGITGVAALVNTQWSQRLPTDVWRNYQAKVAGVDTQAVHEVASRWLEADQMHLVAVGAEPALSRSLQLALPDAEIEQWEAGQVPM